MTTASLKQALGDCRRIGSSVCELQTSYETVSDAIFYVFDEKDDEPVRVLFSKGHCQLNVINGSNEDICVVKTDKCLFTDEVKKCDCILFNSSKAYLVEIKSGRKKNNLRYKAIEQLSSTIKILESNKIDLSKHEVKAIICFKSGSTRPTQATNNTQKEKFRMTHSHIRLEEVMEITF